MKKLLLAATLVLPVSLAAQNADTTRTVTWGGFVDGYYAYQFHRSGPGDIPLLTQPGRHNEFNINLAFVEAKLASDRVRGRVALQAGTSVALNYAGEPRAGLASGPELQRHIQEAVIGYRVGNALWVDGGIYLSHIGSETWISRDCWTYARSLIAEYSPYYESGLKLTWSPGKLVTSLNLVNGWQNISENNSDKAVGVRLDYTLSNRVSVGYSNFLGNEAPDSVASRLRLFHDFYGKVMLTDKLGILATFDVGNQNHTVNDDRATWYGYSVIGHLQATSKVALVGRAERYSDPHHVIISTPNGFVANAYSIGLDMAPQSAVLWRTELRTFDGASGLFTNGRGGVSSRMTFLVTSLALTL